MFNNIEKKRIWIAMLPSMFFVTIIWLIYLLEATDIFQFSVHQLGILPRHFSGMVGVLLSPLIHVSLSHILSNTLPLLILIWFLFFFYSKIAFRSFFLLWFFSGVFTWLIGRDLYHIGASGLIFSMAFFLFFSGIFRKHIPLVAVSMILAFVYGSMVWSIFPFAELVDKQLSWEGHLAGSIAGLIIAIIYRKHEPKKPEYFEDEEDESEVETEENSISIVE